jgi:hypothetical protein
MATVTQALQYNMPKELWGGLPATPACAYKDNFHLVGADATWTVPTGAAWVVVTVSGDSTTDVWWKIGAAAAAPAAHTTDASGAGCFPKGSRMAIAVRAGTALHLFGTADGTLEWYSQGNPAV